MSFFDRFFERHGAHGNGIVGADQMNFGRLGDCRILVDHDRDSGFLGEADDGLNVFLRGMAVPLLVFFTFAGGTLLGLPARLVFDRLLFEMVEGFVDGDAHVLGLSEADQRTIAGANGDFGFMTVLLDGQNDLGFESVAQDFADFREAGFNFFADGGGDFVLSSGVLHVHERHS